jgi:GT2 family glycosyltransferase
MTNKPLISFIVPVRNDAAGLERCLRSIQRSGLPAEQLEIVVADNGSIDGSIQVARRHGARVIVDNQVRVAELRNLAAHHATGGILAFVDADNELAPSWAAAAVEILRDENIGAAGALYDAPADGTWVQRAYGHLRGHTRGTAEVHWLGGGNMVVPAATFQAVGGFSTSLETCEDVDLCNRILGLGLRIVGDERLASVHHGDPSTLSSLFRAELWRGRDNLRVSFRRPISWRVVPSAVVAIVDAAMVLAGAMGAALMFRAIRPGLDLVVAAVLVVALGAAIRVARQIARQSGLGLSAAAQLFVVTSVYDLARALSLIARVPHRRSRPASLVVAR